MFNQAAIEELLHIKEAFEKIASATGKEKLAVLANYRDALDGSVKEALYQQYNPYIIYGLSTAKLNKSVVLTDKFCSRTYLPDLWALCSYFKKAPAATNLMIADLQAIISQIRLINSELADFLGQFMCKDCKIGVTATTLNKVYGKNFIPTFGCMLAEKYFEHPEFVMMDKSFTLTQKLDGIRCLGIYNNGKVTFYSRQGQPIEGLVEIEADMREWFKNDEDGWVLDGELLVDNAHELTSAEGYKRTTKVVRSKGEKHGVTYHVFDILPLEDFQFGRCDQPYINRRMVLECATDFEHLRVLPVLYAGYDTDQIMVFLEQARKVNQEGIMININGAPYECKRTKNLLKVKVMQDCDLKIIGYEEGKGANTGKLGAFIVDYKGNKLGVGSGYTYTDRIRFWEMRDELIGRVISVQYFEETHDVDGNLSLRFPVFKELRETGKEVSYS